MEDDGVRVVAGCFKGAGSVIGERPVDLLVVEIPQFGTPFPDERAFAVELTALENRVEDSEVRLGIHSGGRAPLPSSVVAGQVKVEEEIGKVRLTSPPIDQKILGQEHRDHHAKAIVHPAGGVEAPHRGIDDGVAGLTFAPSAEVLVGAGPMDGIGFRLESLALPDMRELGEDHLVELAPDELGLPLARSGGFTCHGGAEALANRDGAESKMNAEAARAFDAGDVAILAVAGDFGEEVVQALLTPLGSGGEPEIGIHEADLRHGFVAECHCLQGVRTGKLGEVGGSLGEIGWSDDFPPLTRIRGEDSEGFAGVVEHLSAFEDDVVFDGLELATRGAESSRDLGISFESIGFVVMTRDHQIGSQQGGELRNLFNRVADDGDETSPESSQFLIDFFERAMDERESSIRPTGQGVEDDRVVDEDDHHFARSFAGQGEGGMIVEAQIAANPAQGTGSKLRHVSLYELKTR